jgi:hypothetical protein
MARIDLHIKVVVDVEPGDNVEKLAAEICRNIRKVYEVREAELSNYVRHSADAS